MGDFFEMIVMVVGAIVLLAVVFTIPLWLLWNWLMPTIFGLTKITILQSAGLMLLSSFLFKSTSSSMK